MIRPSFFLKNKPGGRTPHLLLAYNAPKEAVRLAEAVGCRVLLIPPWDRLDKPVSAHPDMLIFPLPFEDGSIRILMPEEYYRQNAAFWENTGLPILLTEHPFGKQYPSDIGLNQLVMKNTLFGKLDAAAPEILSAYRHRIAVRQGYTRCSLLKLSESAAVTSDKGLAEALAKQGTEVLLIEPGHIQLEGYDCGFIGGASFPLPDGMIGLFGDLTSHPDHSAIERFANAHGVELRSVRGPLSDFGGGVLIE